MTTTGIPSVPSMCRKGMDFVAYWASSRVPPVLLSAPAVWSTVHQLLCASLIPLTFPPTSMIVVVMRRPAGERSWGTEQRAKRIDLGRDPRLCLREPICSVAGRETARSSYSAKSMIGGFRCSKAKHRSARPLHSDQALGTASKTRPLQPIKMPRQPSGSSVDGQSYQRK
jgi:hypothetical protein